MTNWNGPESQNNFYFILLSDTLVRSVDFFSSFSVNQAFKADLRKERERTPPHPHPRQVSHCNADDENLQEAGPLSPVRLQLTLGRSLACF